MITAATERKVERENYQHQNVQRKIEQLRYVYFCFMFMCCAFEVSLYARKKSW